MQDSINTIISNALIVNKDILSKNIKPIINQIKIALESNKEAILQANKIDQKKRNYCFTIIPIQRNCLNHLKMNQYY